MRLTLVRHAIAEDPRAGLRDAARAPTDERRERFAEEVRGLRRLDVRFERLLHSPLRRALETAELLAPLVEERLEVSALLAASPGPELLEQLSGEKLAL